MDKKLGVTNDLSLLITLAINIRAFSMANNSSVKSRIEKWENEKNMLLLEEQDLFNATKTFMNNRTLY